MTAIVQFDRHQGTQGLRIAEHEVHVLAVDPIGEGTVLLAAAGLSAVRDER